MIGLKKLKNRLSNKVIKLWAISNLLTYTSLIAIVALLMLISKLQKWNDLFFSLLSFLIALFLIMYVIESVFIKKIKYYLFSFEIGNEFVQIQKGGLLFEKLIVIPVEDIYFIDIYQGPLLRKFGLCALNLNTIAHKHEIVGIDSNYAKVLKEKMENNEKFKNKEKYIDGEAT